MRLASLFAVAALLFVFACGCRPVVRTDYFIETERDGKFTTERIDHSLNRFRVFRVDEYNNGKRKDVPLCDVNP